MEQKIAEFFAEEGTMVVLTARGREILDAVVEDLKNKGYQAVEYSDHYVYFPSPECEPVDQAYACLYLASKTGRHVKGQVLQYYDIPSRYEIPSAPETVTSEKAGEVYYSDPNRIVLFFGDAEVAGEYTKVGYFDDTEEFKAAVEDNPVLEGWGNKIVLINSAK